MDIPDSEIHKLEEIIREITEKSIDPYYERFNENVDRIINLLELYTKLKKNSEFQSHSSLDDILRTSTVFTHAALEDFLRTLASHLLPYSNSEALNQIPLAGLNPSGRAEKFYLGHLLKFKGKLVEELIQESVDDSLKNSNFNNTNEIAQFLKGLGVDISKVNNTFSDIDELMQRRHQIVHRADKQKDSTSDNKFEAIDPKLIEKWIIAVLRLISDILRETAYHHVVNNETFKRNMDKFNNSVS